MSRLTWCTGHAIRKVLDAGTQPMTCVAARLLWIKKSEMLMRGKELL